MSEAELQSLLADWHSLIPEARTALADEFASRNLAFEIPILEEDAPPGFRELVTIRSYRDSPKPSSLAELSNPPGSSAC
jgi:hypothetical protein